RTLRERDKAFTVGKRHEVERLSSGLDKSGRRGAIAEESGEVDEAATRLEEPTQHGHGLIIGENFQLRAARRCRAVALWGAQIEDRAAANGARRCGIAQYKAVAGRHGRR